VVDGDVVGTADLVVVPNLTHRGEPWAVLENVIVTSSHQRMGVGSALLEHLIDVARAARCCKIQLLSGKHRTWAHEFYESMGFEAVAEGFKLYFDESFAFRQPPGPEATTVVELRDVALQAPLLSEIWLCRAISRGVSGARVPLISGGLGRRFGTKFRGWLRP
jgi:ribosomal protein S18 acetylase RimI-like enzyme